jgi:ornithine carbamoyltransferase
MPSDFLSMNDLTDSDLQMLLDWGDGYHSRTDSTQPLAGQSVVLLFEKPSLRTKLSFDIGIHELGGHAVYMGSNEVGLDVREPVEDVASVVERWVAAIVARVNDHGTLQRLAARTSVPVINALSDVEHPCQAVADLVTVRQKLGKLDGLKMAYIGDANNCALSFGIGCATVGSQFAIASPDGYAFDTSSVSKIISRGAAPLLTDDPREAIADADVVYTDAWTSMGQEAEAAERRQAFQGFQINDDLLAVAKPGALIMHPMPVHYGEEMPAGMLDHPQSVAFDQAENRLHAQKAVLRLVTVGE